MFADALVAAPYMRENGAILLTDGVERIDADVVFGGEKTLPGFPGVKRFAGTDRYETAARIAEDILSGTVILASGEDFPDALTAANLAGPLRAPILLTEANALPQACRILLNRYHAEKVIVVGGERAVAPSVLEDVAKAMQPSTQPDVPETETSDSGSGQTPSAPDLSQEVKFQSEHLRRAVARLMVDEENLWDPAMAISREEARTHRPTRKELHNLKRIHITGPFMDEDYNDVEPEDIVGLEEAIHVEHVYLSRFRIDDFSALRQMKQLKSLTLNRCDVSDLSVIRDLRGLEVLNLEMNKISDLNGLERLRRLQSLNLMGNPLQSIQPLRGMTTLKRLELQNTGIKDISALAELNRLVYLDLSGNELRSIAELGAKPELDFLNLTGKDLRHGDDDPSRQGNVLSDIDVLAGMPKLRVLYLQDTKEITNLAPLEGLEYLEALTVRNNKIESVEPLSALTRLQYLHIYENNVEDVSPLAGLTNLVELNISKNRVEDISSLRDLDRLIVLFAYDNRIADPAPLEELQNLRVANLSQNRIVDLSGVAGQAADDRREQYVMDSQTVETTAHEVSERRTEEGKTWITVANPIRGIDGNHVEIHMEAIERSEWDDILNRKIDAFNAAVDALKEKGITVRSKSETAHATIEISVPQEETESLDQAVIPFMQLEGIHALYYENDFPEIVSSIVTNTFEYPNLKEGEGWPIDLPFSGDLILTLQ